MHAALMLSVNTGKRARGRAGENLFIFVDTVIGLAQCTCPILLYIEERKETRNQSRFVASVTRRTATQNVSHEQFAQHAVIPS